MGANQVRQDVFAYSAHAEVLGGLLKNLEMISADKAKVSPRVNVDVVNIAPMALSLAA